MKNFLCKCLIIWAILNLYSDIIKSSSQIRFVVLDSSKFNKKEFEGEVIVLLEELKDQNIHDVWLDLFDKNGNKTRGQLHVKLQWIHSKVLLFI